VPTLTLAVDSNSDGIYNDPGDFRLTSGEAIIRATVLNASSSPVFGDLVVFGADSTEVTFPDGETKVTNSDGEAFVRIKVVPSELRNFDTPVNVSAVSSVTGAFNILTLFVTPIEVSQIAVSANPSTVASGGTSSITATVRTAAGTVVPDGTAVNFTATGGSIVPFGQTTDGVATAQFTAPTLTAGSSNLPVTISASSAGKSANTSVTVTAPQLGLTITPGARTVVSQATAQTVTFAITGGTGPYSTVSADPTKVYNSTVNNGSWSGSSIAATIAANACPGSVTLTVFDSAGASKTATVTIVVATPFSVTPLAITCNSGVCTPGAVTVNGGSLPYTTSSSNNALVPTPTPPAASGGTFNVTAVSSPTTNVTITVGDACGATASVAVTVNP
jgi:hypothetical protein